MRLRLFYRSSVWCVLEFTARSPSLCGISMLGVTSRCYATHKINTLCVAALYSRMAPINNSLHKNLWLNKRTEFTLKIEGLELKSHDHGIYFFIFLLVIHLSVKSEQHGISIKTALGVCFSRISQTEALNHIDNVTP